MTNTTTMIETMIRDLENYAQVTRESDTRLSFSCRANLCDDVDQMCAGTGWHVAWSGEGNTNGNTGNAYEYGTVTMTNTITMVD